jgi:Ca-activated chloride channel family protein
MAFLWPEMLFLILVLPVLAAIYLRLRYRKDASDFSRPNLVVVKETHFLGGKGRRIPPLLFLMSLTCLITAIARPTLSIPIASKYKTVVLAIDSSISMRSDGLSPSRIDAARTVARDFLREQPRRTRIGVVSFAANASVEQTPTSDRKAILDALDAFPLQHGTAIGSGILLSLKMIFPGREFILDSSDPLHVGFVETSVRGPISPGSYPYAAVILLSDGESTMGPEPIQTAKIAARHGVRIFTVGFGTPGGHQVDGSDGVSMPEPVDEKTLKEIAEVTKGAYFNATSTSGLSRINEGLDSLVAFQEEETEITALFVATGAIFALLAVSLSVVRFNRVL